MLPRMTLPNLRLQSQTILIVDDEPDILESLRILVQVGFGDTKILTARSSLEGLTVLAKDAVDLIITDFRMPQMNGLEFLREARKRGAKASAIMITAFPDMSVALNAIKEAEIEDFFVKPPDSDHLLYSIGAILCERRARELRKMAYARMQGRSESLPDSGDAQAPPF